jgi:hypothetical protein
MKEKASQLTRGGYSIFDETMVDMPWTDIEALIQKGALILEVKM